MHKLVVIGNAISADIIYSYLRKDERYQVVCFSTDGEFIQEKEKFGLPVVDLNDLGENFSPSEHQVVFGIGYKQNNQVRAELFQRVNNMGYSVFTYIHPRAHILNDAHIGEGSIILSGVVVEPFAAVGKNSVIWSNCVIGHHVKVGDNCWVAAGTVIAGEAEVGHNSFLGVNVTVSNQVRVGAFNIIGGHTAVHKDTKENEVYISGQGEKLRFSAKDYDQYFLK